LIVDVLVTYDISTVTDEGERRLARVAKVCESYGTRTQYSVFECRLSPARVQRLVAALADIIDPAADSIHLYRFEGELAASRFTLGRAPHRELGAPWIV
jgi:CRISPR-associated protein Cas2